MKLVHDSVSVIASRERLCFGEFGEFSQYIIVLKAELADHPVAQRVWQRPVH
jgi:hypothetical protein